MATETIYVVQTWVPGKRGQPQADKPMPFTSADAAVRRAYRLEEEKLGVLVFAQAGDVEIGATTSLGSSCSWERSRSWRRVQKRAGVKSFWRSRKDSKVVAVHKVMPLL